MKKAERIQEGTIVEYNHKRWFVYDWCPACNWVGIERYDKRKRVKYSDLKLLLF